MPAEFTTVEHVMAELDNLHQLHAEHEQAVADAQAEIAKRRPATPLQPEETQTDEH